MRKAARVKKKYFLEEEFWETLSPTNTFRRDELISILSSRKQVNLTTKQHTYKSSGAFYSG